MHHKDDVKDAKTLAMELCEIGVETLTNGQVPEAIGCFQRSIALFPTADALTHLGWAHSFRGELDTAIRYCTEAIVLDPDFGSPYNDIGAYLVDMGRAEEAVEWFGKAKNAGRYLTPQYPYLNMARLYARAGQWGKAALELQIASVLTPCDERVRALMEHFLGQVP